MHFFILGLCPYYNITCFNHETLLMLRLLCSTGSNPLASSKLIQYSTELYIAIDCWHAAFNREAQNHTPSCRMFLCAHEPKRTFWVWNLLCWVRLKRCWCGTEKDEKQLCWILLHPKWSFSTCHVPVHYIRVDLAQKEKLQRTQRTAAELVAAASTGQTEEGSWPVAHK